MLNYMNGIAIGVKTNGSNSVQVQQRFPIEMAYICFHITCDVGYGVTYSRWLRDDVFTMGHNPYKQFGDFQYQLMSSPNGNPEIAKYYIEDRITDIFSSKIITSSEANPGNITLSLQGAPTISDQVSSGMKFAFSSLMNYNLGHQDGTLEFIIGADKYNKNFYTKTPSGEFVTLDANNKYEVGQDVNEFGAVAPLVQFVDGKFVAAGSVLANNKTTFKISRAGGQYASQTINDDGTISVKFNTTNIPVFATASMTPMQ